MRVLNRLIRSRQNFIIVGLERDGDTDFEMEAVDIPFDEQTGEAQ